MFSLDISVPRLFNGLECANANVGIEQTIGSARDACGEAILALHSDTVLHVCGHAHIAEIDEAIVSGVSVDVVNLVSGPNPINPEPSETMLQISAFVDLQHIVVLKACGNIADASIPKLDKPREKSSLGIVMQKLAQTLGGKLGHVCLHLGHRGNSGRKVMSLLFALQELDRTHNLHFQPV